MRLMLGWACGLLVALAGCGGSTGGGAAVPPERLALQNVGELYRVYTLSNNKPPASLADLKALSTVGAAGYKALGSGEIVVRYGAKMVDTNEGPATTPSDEVLAYGKNVPEGGGDVLMLDRTIKTMTPEEFKAARKAGKG